MTQMNAKTITGFWWEKHENPNKEAPLPAVVNRASSAFDLCAWNALFEIAVEKGENLRRRPQVTKR